MGNKQAQAARERRPAWIQRDLDNGLAEKAFSRAKPGRVLDPSISKEYPSKRPWYAGFLR